MIKKNENRKATIKILEAQLARGTKPRKNGWSYNDYFEDEVVLDEKGRGISIRLQPNDIYRIGKEIVSLQSKQQ